MPTFFPHIFLNSFADNFLTFVFSISIIPSVIFIFGSNNLSMLSAVILFPHPDSPIIPTVSPLFNDRDISSKNINYFFPELTFNVKFFTSSILLILTPVFLSRI